MSAPGPHVRRPAPPRYAVACDEQGWAIVVVEEVGEALEPVAVLRPSEAGHVRELLHSPDRRGADYRADMLLIRAVIRALIKPHERSVFRELHSERRRRVLEEVVGLAEEMRRDGTAGRYLAAVAAGEERGPRS